jgi:uncharacterized protein (TIRG00374 family)
VKITRAVIGLGLITVIYLIALIWVDSRNQVFSELPKLLAVMPVLVGMSFLSYLLRYTRWYWLLCRAGSKTPVVLGFLAYLAGFAFTATPGKMGELVRIRYLIPMGVAPWKVLAAFVYERAFDLIVVLLLATLLIGQKDIFVAAFGFVLLILAALILVALNYRLVTKLIYYLRLKNCHRMAKIFRILRDGLSGCRLWLTPLDVTIALVLGFLAWSITSLSFVYLLQHLGVSIPLQSAIALYPLAMLAGAASMMPGGVGTTEVTLVALLVHFEVALSTALLAAIGIRLLSLWFAIICGFVALGTLEFRSNFNRLAANEPRA